MFKIYKFEFRVVIHMISIGISWHGIALHWITLDWIGIIQLEVTYGEGMWICMTVNTNVGVLNDQNWFLDGTSPGLVMVSQG